jgi:Tfp pilus assembly protein PilX
MKRFTLALADPRGSILLGGLMLVFVATLLGLSLFELAVVDNHLILGDNCGVRALYAAESGLQVAYRDLVNGTSNGTVDFTAVLADTSYATRRDLSGYATADNRTLGSATQATRFDVQAQVIGGNKIQLWSTGTPTGSCPGGALSGTRTVRAVIEKGPPTDGHSFVGLDHFLTGGAGFLLDSFDSSLGAYDCLGGAAGCTAPAGVRNKCQATTPPFGCNVEIWTNGPGRTTLDGGPIYGSVTSASGEVKLKTTPTIYGSIKYDSTDGLFTGNPAQVVGGVTAEPSPGIAPITLPKVPNPAGVSGAVDWDCRTNGGFVSAATLASHITSGTYTYSSATGVFTASSAITIDPLGSTLTLCFSDFSMAGRDLTIPSSATQPVQIYIGSDTGGGTIGQALLSGKIVNSTGQSKYLRVFSISNKGNDDVWVTSDGTGAFVFAYAPNGQVQVKGGGMFFGAAFGQQLEANGGSQMHFDKALLAESLPGITGGGSGTPSFSLKTWAQCPPNNQFC